jgi:hypothetical protein
MKFLAFLLMWTYCVCLFGGSAATAAETKIYKTIDEDGNVVFTDVPPKGDDSAEEINVSAPNIADLGTATPSVDPIEAQSFAYRSLRITSPEHDESVREPTGDVEVVVEVQPQLRAEHELRLLVDGAAQQVGRNSNFVLSRLDRGTHTLQVEVVHRNGEVLVASEPSVFHLQQYSELTAPNQDRPTSLPRAVTPPRRRSN